MEITKTFLRELREDQGLRDAPKSARAAAGVLSPPGLRTCTHCCVLPGATRAARCCGCAVAASAARLLPGGVVAGHVDRTLPPLLQAGFTMNALGLYPLDSRINLSILR